jgi:hypothetical protein
VGSNGTTLSTSESDADDCADTACNPLKSASVEMVNNIVDQVVIEKRLPMGASLIYVEYIAHASLISGAESELGVLAYIGIFPRV